jgi:hypothetical protein
VRPLLEGRAVGSTGCAFSHSFAVARCFSFMCLTVQL